MRIASLLWDKVDRTTGLRNLRQALDECRRDLRGLADCLILEDGNVALGDGVAVDIAEISLQLASGVVPQRLMSSALSQLTNSRHLAMSGILPERALLMDALDHAIRTIMLDPDDSTAHLARAWSTCMLHNTTQAMFPSKWQ